MWVGILILVLVVLVSGIWLGFMASLSVRRQLKTIKRQSVAHFLIGLASLCLLTAFGSALHGWSFLKTAQRATGTITEMRERIDREHQVRMYAPTFTFTDTSGAQHTVSPILFTSPPQHQIGDKVTILYRASDPGSARIEGFWDFWGLPIIAGLIGGFYLLIGILILFWHRITVRFK